MVNSGLRLLGLVSLFLAWPMVAGAQFVAAPPVNDHVYAELFDELYRALAPELNESFRLPREVALTSASCGQSNAFYQPATSQVILCSELVDEMLGALQQARTDPSVIQLALLAQVVFVLFHEVGHAMIDVLDVPVIGQEEDAADQLAAIFMSDEPILAMWAAEFWKSRSAGQTGGYISNSQFADEHDLSQQRFFNLICWTYGADPLVRGYVAQHAGLPSERAQRCQNEYARMRSGWERLLGGHLADPDAFADLDPKRNASGYWRFMESMSDSGDQVRCTASGTVELWQMAEELAGTMNQEGSCVWFGTPTENSGTQAISSGTVDGTEVSFEIANCVYDGTLEEPELASLDGTMICTVQTTDGGTLDLRGTWKAVR